MEMKCTWVPNRKNKDRSNRVYYTQKKKKITKIYEAKYDVYLFESANMFLLAFQAEMLTN